ncbi:hypothetical protein Ctob_008840 [Chrysochromulina tobinii]|uniref:WWE domain-containing protein n=1 Tax=Chrysochromulina tobinii TaxID=1460289 RepID=A0A0M0KCY5_9EUKA|nr:hypothetical protein Ctob_008840 [Chrysochromulina tobinii]|eukprot:KOO36695.1 hypothetical protein Ctob_008840 [Chrysochromulina sp. CCMP291]
MLTASVDEHTAKAVCKPVRAGGWYWVHAGSLQPYTWHVQLELEAAYHRGDAELQISANGLKYVVAFDRSAPPTLDRPTAKQRGYEKERDVFRVLTSDELPLLSEARHTARLERAEDVLPYVAELKAAADALEAARRGVTATYEAWLAATAPLQLLREQSVALAKEKVNRNTTILVLSAGADGALVSTSEAAGTAVGAARKAARDENARRGAVVGAKRKELIAIYDEVEFVESLTQGTASEGSFPCTAGSVDRPPIAIVYEEDVIAFVLSEGARELSVDPSFVWTMLQTASVSDGAPSKMQPSIILIDWVPDPARRSLSDGQPWQPPVAAESILTPDEAGPSEYLLCAASAERPAGAAGLVAGLEMQSGSVRPSLEMQSGSIWLGSAMLEDGSSPGTLRLRDGGNTHLEAICARRQKPRIRHAYRVSADTTIEAGHGQMHSKFWLLHFASVHDDGREVVRLVVSSANAQAGYQATPHLMLYVLHEPLPADGQPPAIRRLLLTSANLSAAPWGYARSGEIEIRNFELGVCVAPEWPAELVEPLGSPKGPDQAGRSHRVWAQAIPFHLERRAPCTDPFLGKGIGTRSDGRAEIGHLNY